MDPHDVLPALGEVAQAWTDTGERPCPSQIELASGYAHITLSDSLVTFTGHDGREEVVRDRAHLQALVRLHDVWFATRARRWQETAKGVLATAERLSIEIDEDLLEALCAEGDPDVLVPQAIKEHLERKRH